MAEGVTFSETKHEPEFCESCALEKHHKIHSKQSATQHAELPGERLYCDLFGGGNSLPEIGNIKYITLIVDDATCLKIAVTLKTKNAIRKKVINTIKRVKTHTGQRVKFFRSDGGSEFQNLKTTFEKKKILSEKSTPYTQDQNDVSERAIHTILKKTQTMLIYSGLPYIL